MRLDQERARLLIQTVEDTARLVRLTLNDGATDEDLLRQRVQRLMVAVDHLDRLMGAA